MLLEKLQKQVEQNLLNISSSLQALKSQKKLLTENAEKVKSNIKGTTDVHVDLLRVKERQLLRQVEFVTAHQNSLIDDQIANILLSKGALMTSRDILSKCNSTDDETLLKITDSTHVNLKPVLPLKMVSVQLETNPLTNAIEHFGQAHLPDSIMHHHSSVVPAKIEDYGDSDQVVLHKSINVTGEECHLSEKDSPLTINVTFPKLPNNSWLASSQKKNQYQQQNFDTSKDVSKWLADLRIAEEKEDTKMSVPNKIEYEDNDSTSTFQYLDPPISGTPIKTLTDMRPKSCASSSIEVVNYFDVIKDVPNYKCSNLGNESNIVKTQYEPCSFPIEFSCQANELCNSYKDCVCKGYCKALENEKVIQTSTWLEKNHFGKVDDIWLHHPKSKTGLKRPLAEIDNADVKHMIEILTSDNKDWLIRPFESNVKESSSTKSILYNPYDKIWLQKPVSTIKPEKNLHTITSVESTFKPKVWLLKDITYERNNQMEVCKIKKEQDIQEKEAKDNKNIENKHNNVSVEEMKEALNELSHKYFPNKKFCSSSHGSSDLIVNEAETDYDRKWKWLVNFNDNSSYSGRELKISSSIDSSSNNLGKWLMEKV